MREHWEFPHARPIPRGEKTLIMGIVNMTPDSFSGRNGAVDPGAAADLALSMLASGADVLDIGAESSRPGADTLTWRDETARLGNVVARIRAATDKPISVDTYHAETAEFVLAQGADIINDITALRGGWDAADSESTAMVKTIAAAGAHAVLMHMPASPRAMQNEPEYIDVVAEVGEFLQERVDFALNNGIADGKIWIDPGFGFGKTFRHNRDLLLQLGTFAEWGYGLLAGMSRKRMIGDALGADVDNRLEGSLALAVMASLGGADMVRVHDVPETARAVGMADAIRLG